MRKERDQSREIDALITD